MKHCITCQCESKKDKVRIIPSECCEAILCDHEVSTEYIKKRRLEIEKNKKNFILDNEE